MPVTPENLKQPEGEIIAAHFPGITLDTYLQAWITQGEAQAASLSGAAQDLAVTYWAYYRAWSYRFDLLKSNPAEIIVDAGRTKRKYDVDQRTTLGQERDDWLDRFNALTGSQGASVAVGQMNAVKGVCPACRLRYCRCMSGL